METTGIAISSGAVGAICGVVSAYVRARLVRRSRIEPDPSPFPVRKVADCISVGECNRRMKALEERMDKVERRLSDGLDSILKKLDAMDARGEERARQMNVRLDPVVERVAANSARIDMIDRRIGAGGGLK